MVDELNKLLNELRELVDRLQLQNKELCYVLKIKVNKTQQDDGCLRGSNVYNIDGQSPKT